MTAAELTRLKNRIDTIANNVLCDMKPGWDDSIEGFNKACDLVRDIFKEEIDRAASRAPAQPCQAEFCAACGRHRSVHPYDLCGIFIPHEPDVITAPAQPVPDTVSVPIKLLHSLWCYGILKPVEGVVYEYGPHQKCLHAADDLIRDHYNAIAAQPPAAPVHQEDACAAWAKDYEHSSAAIAAAKAKEWADRIERTTRLSVARPADSYGAATYKAHIDCFYNHEAKELVALLRTLNEPQGATTRGDVIEECASVADDLSDCSARYIASRIRELALTRPHQRGGE